MFLYHILLFVFFYDSIHVIKIRPLGPLVFVKHVLFWKITLSVQYVGLFVYLSCIAVSGIKGLQFCFVIAFEKC